MARDLVCFSHLRWDFVYQRPNHLMARAARNRRVFFVEEPTFAIGCAPRTTTVTREGVTVVTPTLPTGLGPDRDRVELARLMDDLFVREGIERPVLWYYTPMALPWTRHLDAGAVVYDSMDNLAGFRAAPPGLVELESELLRRVSIVFCGGASLHERMRHRHQATHCFPSSVDIDHFRRARGTHETPADQAAIGHPRIGYAGVIDERIDLGLIEGVAAARQDWQIVLVGPIVKISPNEVPALPNVHRLGMKRYAELPAYLGGWDVGWMPFARNDATRYISPTKTPEYLAAGLPVVSTSIHDVVDPYGRHGLVSIADNVADTIEAVARALTGIGPALGAVDEFLATGSWDRTWAGMAELVDALERRAPARPAQRDRRRTTAPVRAGAPDDPAGHAPPQVLGRSRRTHSRPSAEDSRRERMRLTDGS